MLTNDFNKGLSSEAVWFWNDQNYVSPSEDLALCLKSGSLLEGLTALIAYLLLPLL